MTAMDRLAAVAERVVAKHVRAALGDDPAWWCECGWVATDHLDADSEYAAHLAAMVAAAQADELGLREEQELSLPDHDGFVKVDTEGRISDLDTDEELALTRSTRLVSDWTTDTTSKEHLQRHEKAPRSDGHDQTELDSHHGHTGAQNGAKGDSK